MTILDSFKKLAKAWGIEPKGDNIADAINNVVENIPFGVKTETVEIVPEQSVTYELSEQNPDGFTFYGCFLPTPIKENAKYTVVINGVKYINTAKYSEYSGVVIENPDEPFYIIDGEIYWLSTLGETISLAIYGEEQTIIPLDAKFAGDNIAVFIDASDGYHCNKTYEEVKTLFYNRILIAYFKTNPYGFERLCNAVYMYKESDTICIGFTMTGKDNKNDIVLCYSPDGSIVEV